MEGAKTQPMGLWSARLFKKEWSLIPTLAICGGAVVMCSAYVGYMCLTKPDLSFRPWSWSKESPPYQGVGPTDVRKMVSPHVVVARDPEIEALKREIGSYKA